MITKDVFKVFLLLLNMDSTTNECGLIEKSDHF